ncbi:unnamed protein product, partial [Lymnaea stagnalis]
MIDNYYMMVLCAIGLPGNALTIVTILAMESISPATILVAFLASCDIGALVSKLTLNRMINQHVYFGSVGCKLVNTLTLSFATIANWTLVLICLERFIAVRFPLQKVYLATKHRCTVAAFALSVIIAALASAFFVMPYDADDTGYECVTTRMSAEMMFLTQLLFYVVFPLAFIAVFTSGTVMTLCAYQRQRRAMFRKRGWPDTETRQTTGNFKSYLLFARHERREKTINVLVIFTGVLFIVIHIPPCIFFLGFADSYSSNDAKWYLLTIIHYLILDSSHVLNFFLFFLSARKFRSQLFRII